MLTETATYLGPATVAECAGDRLRLKLPHGETWARSALAFPYEPRSGDVVLVIEGEEVFVIGVLLGRGKTVFQAPGDLEIRARGTLDLVGDVRVRMSGPEVTVKADRFETMARSVFERFVDCYRWVKDTLQIRAGRTRTVVTEDARIRAERIIETAEKDVRIDGEKIHLG